MRVTAFGFLVAAGLLGCGARSALLEGSGSGAGAGDVGPGAGGGSSSSGAGGATGSGGAGGLPCTWGFAPVVTLSPPHIAYASAVVDGAHLLLATGDHPGWAVQSLSFELETSGTSHALPLHNAGEAAPTFAAGFGRAVIVEATGHGCRAVALDADGDPSGDETTIAPGNELCWSTTATPNGFLTFTTPYQGSGFPAGPLGAAVLGPDGALLDTKVDLAGVSDPPGPRYLASASLDDGSTLIVWAAPAGEVYAQRFGPEGDPLTAAVDLFHGNPILVATSLGSTFMLAWNDGPKTAPVLRTATLDAALNLGPVQTIAASTTDVVKAIVSGAPHATALLVTAGSEAPFAGRWLDANGVVAGAQMTATLVADGSFANLVATPAGPILFGTLGKVTVAQPVLCN